MKSFIFDFAKEFSLLAVLGLLVAIILPPVLSLDTIRQMDLSFADYFMRQLVLENISDPGRPGPRFVFVNIGEKTCGNWAGTTCTASPTIPRDKLADIANAIARSVLRGNSRPRLVMFDVELSPLPAPANSADAALCGAIAGLSRQVPVEGLRPLLVGFEASGPHNTSLPSILDSAIEGRSGCGGGGPANIWLASPLVQADFDGAVRSVHAWDMARTADGRNIVVPGVGLLGAALLNQNANSVALGCVHDAGACPSQKLLVGGGVFDLKTAPPPPSRIMFLVPYGTGGRPGIVDYGYVPSVVDPVEADDFIGRLTDDRQLLRDAVVVVGASYTATGDLYRTPLNSQFPGAMIHANAIYAYATGKLIEEQQGWSVELLLIFCASVTGALFYAAGQRAGHHLSWPWTDLTEILIALVGVVVTMSVVFVVALVTAFDQLERGSTLVGVVTPACFVALEGFYNILHDIRQFILRSLGKP